MSVSLFWGVVIILFGISLILKSFKIDLPVVKIFFAFFFIYLGIRLFIGKEFSIFSGREDKQSVVFGEKTMSIVEDGKEYNVVFSGAKFDLRGMDIPEGKTVKIDLNTVFGGSQVIVSRNLPIHVQSHTVFAGTKMPDGNTSAFGNLTYDYDSIKNAQPRLILETNTVFGGLQIRRE